MKQVNSSKLFTASCMALVVTSMTFAIRAGMLGDLGNQFGLSDTELAQIASMAFFGFPVATTLGGFFVDTLGMKRWMWVAFAAHLLGLLLTIFAGGFWTLFFSTFLVGFANGMVEAVCNPLVASLFPKNKIVMLNKFHVWFPGGIVIGALLAAGMKTIGLGWELQVALILIPTIIYGYLFWGQEFPKTERVEKGFSVQDMLSACVNPLFLFMMACMFFTANTELSTGQWVDKLLGGAGANPLIILALVNGLMAFGRFFGGPIIHKLSPAGVLLLSAVLAALGIYLLSHTSGVALYAAAIVFAMGVCFFWPTMLGFVNEYIPKSGAMGLSLMGGMGMLGNWAYQSYFIGPRLDGVKRNQLTSLGYDVKNLGDKEFVAFTKTIPAEVLQNVEAMAGKNVLGNINFLPLVLIAAFALLYFYMKKNKVTAA